MIQLKINFLNFFLAEILDLDIRGVVIDQFDFLFRKTFFRMTGIHHNLSYSLAMTTPSLLILKDQVRLTKSKRLFLLEYLRDLVVEDDSF